MKSPYMMATLIAAAMLTLSSPLYAQNSPQKGYGQEIETRDEVPPGQGMRRFASQGENGRFMHNANRSGRPDRGFDDQEVVTRLNLTPNQQAQFQALQDARKAHYEKMQAQREAMQQARSDENWQRPDPVTASQKMIDQMETQLEQRKQTHQLLFDFYNSLSEEQKSQLQQVMNERSEKREARREARREAHQQKREKRRIERQERGGTNNME
jgi:hypothetical protein